VQHGTIETVSTYLNAFVFSADVGSVRQCKISAKYGCSVTIALLFTTDVAFLHVLMGLHVTVNCKMIKIWWLQKLGKD